MKQNVLLRLAMLALPLAIAAFTGCKDSGAVVAPDQAGTYAKSGTDYMVFDHNFTGQTDLSGLAASGQNLGGVVTQGDPTRDAGTGDRNPGNTPLRPANLERIFKQLELTRQQDSLIRLCIRQYNACVKNANDRYNAARRDLYNALQQVTERLKNAVQNGTMTPEEARAQLREFRERYRYDLDQLAQKYRNAVDECWKNFLDCVKSVLTDRQWQKFQELLAKM